MNESNNNYIVINNKGGVGKSTFSQQILATYNLLNHGSAFIKELDDANKDAESLSESDIISEQVKVESESRLRETIAEYDLINPETKNTIIDVGGNMSTDIFIKALHTSVEVIDYVDAIFIPVIDNGISVDNAKKVYANITGNGKYPEIAEKIIFVINNAAYWRFGKALAENDMPDFEDQMYKRYYDAIDYFKSVNANYIPVIQMDGVENTKKSFNMTAVEIFNNIETLRPAITQQQRDAFKIKDPAEKDMAKTLAGRQKNMLYDVEMFMPCVAFSHAKIKELLIKPEPKTKPKEKAKAES